MKILLIDDHSLFAEGLRVLLKDFDQSTDKHIVDSQAVSSLSLDGEASESKVTGEAAKNEVTGKSPQLSSFNSCELALQEPDPENVELILLDYYLPGLSGVEALAALRDYCPNSRIIVVSALDDPQHIRQIIDAGAAGFIPKTSTFAVMSAALNLVIAGGTYLPPQAINSKSSTYAHHKSPTDEGNMGLDCLSQRQREVLMQVVQGKPNKVIARTLEISEHTVKAHISASFKLLGVKNRTEAVYIAARLNRDHMQKIDEAG